MGAATRMMRTWLLLILTAIPLLGASELGLAAPIVVVYPLTATGDVGSPQTGANIASALADKLVSLGGITVKPFVSGTTRQQFLTAALSQNADYYITGYLTPLGSEVSVLEQVVSTRSGSIVYSTTAFAKTYADAIGPADNLREAILHHAGRGMASLDAPPPSPSPEAIVNSGGNVNILKAFGRKKKPAPAVTAAAAASNGSAAALAGSAAAPAGSAAASAGSTASSGSAPRPGSSAAPAPHAASSPVPVTQAASATAAPSPAARVALAAPAPLAPAGARQLVISTAGSADPDARAYAARSFSSALSAKGIANSLLLVDASDVTAHAGDLCGASSAGGFYATTLALGVPSGKHARGPSARLDVTAYDCRGAATGHESGTANAGSHGTVQSAIDAAAASVASALAKAKR